ncbi:Undecaprenyl-diphosphatase (Bacitracin resistance protein) [Alteracholeplasma palmae J233]|uniref:Undecaprenyl-diphosphatase n=1 Tax=Alteracholeplasma palmae (strain ATCC 49389 / J233) TaxID=1318466 RepID=U4KKH5_ALTPJ|nr:undecaprenyl-diphosphate phosphatase [Alteracholeplasma palmae]CCV64078.1 Undecaprenyl-diphosphatase (Bacitracin resistance protein) [Alteracholeplasma palmae J233]
MTEFIEIIKYIFLGIIQGVTEIFPVSSSGHLSIFSKIFNVDTNNLTIFLMITNAGSFLALLWYYKKDVLGLISGSWNFIFKKKSRNEEQKINDKSEFNYVLKLILAAIPIGITGLLLKDHLPNNLLSTGIALLVTSILLFTIYSLRNRSYTNNVTFKNAAIIGLFQAFAVFPGLSRSGITIVGGQAQKINLKDTLRFSFLCYLLISVPVTLLGIYDMFHTNEPIHILGYSLAFVFSFLGSLFTVKLMNKYVKVKNLIYFSIYCLIIGVTSIILFVI